MAMAEFYVTPVSEVGVSAALYRKSWIKCTVGIDLVPKV